MAIFTIFICTLQQYKSRGLHRTAADDCQAPAQTPSKVKLIIDNECCMLHKVTGCHQHQQSAPDKVFMSNAASEMQLFFTAN